MTKGLVAINRKHKKRSRKYGKINKRQGLRLQNLKMMTPELTLKTNGSGRITYPCLYYLWALLVRLVNTKAERKGGGSGD